MSSYLNCYELVAQVRREVNDHSDNKVKGTDTSGAFSNELILQKINDAQDFLYFFLLARRPELFMTSTTLTGSSSVYALPADCFKIRKLETTDRVPIEPISVHQRHFSTSGGTKFFYYRYGRNIRIDQESMSDNLTLFYFTRPRRLNFGSAAGGGALSITLAATARGEADYYNNMVIEDVTGAFYSTISDYTAARVATIAATATSADYYGLVSELPEEIHPFIYRKAAMELKNDPRSPVPPGPTEVQDFNRDLAAFAGAYGDVLSEDEDPDDIFCDLEPFI